MTHYLGTHPGLEATMELRKHCAYNQTRECFLGLEVAVADFAYASLQNAFSTLTLKPGEGLWLLPFRGLPDVGMQAPLDLVYLDENCQVIDTVESFPTFHITPSSPPSASVLALPAHSIFSSQTQPGDQLVVCVAEEMERRLQGAPNLGGDEGDVLSAVPARERPLWSGVPGVVHFEDRSRQIRPEAGQADETGLIQPVKQDLMPRRNWLQRWWSPEPRRRAPREPATGLAAYFWTGGPPEPHNVKNISATGLYLLTEERWYPGTLVMMVLKKPGESEESVELSLSVHAQAVRSADDGVGMQFIMADSPPARSQPDAQSNAAGRKELDRFLMQLRRGKG